MRASDRASKRHCWSCHLWRLCERRQHSSQISYRRWTVLSKAILVKMRLVHLCQKGEPYTVVRAALNSVSVQISSDSVTLVYEPVCHYSWKIYSHVAEQSGKNFADSYSSHNLWWEPWRLSCLKGMWQTVEASCRGESLAICTIEKANVAINRLIQHSRLEELCCVIVDVSQCTYLLFLLSTHCITQCSLQAWSIKSFTKPTLFSLSIAS